MSLDLCRTRELLQDFDFTTLFIEELGWSQPVARHKAEGEAAGAVFQRRPIAHLSGVVVLEISTGGAIPNGKTRAAISKEISKLYHENLLIFVDAERTQSLWYWAKRDGSKLYPRDHLYVKGQPGDLFLSKLAALVVDISELDAEGNIAITEVASRLKAALDVERVTKRFYKEFQQQHINFLALIGGIADERQRRWYASVLLNRLMFIYFLQRKYFLDGGNTRYLQEKLDQSRRSGPDRYYAVFLQALFFEGFAKPEGGRTAEAKALLGQIKYLNGGLFLPHRVETANPHIRVPDVAFENLFALFERYSWNLNDTPGGDDDEINPDVLGYIFEKYINQKEFGAYYTRPEITGYLCEQTIYKLVLDKINAAVPPPPRQFASMPELLLGLDAGLCRRLLHDVLPSLSLLDPACGSGAFLVAAMKTLINLYSAIVGKIDFLNDRPLADWLAETRASHPSLHYFIKKRIITDNLFGVDIMEEGAEIARLRLFLALVASAHSVEQLEPLPNIDFNILAGNSLIGLLKVDPQRFDAVGEKKPAGKQGLIRLQHEGHAGELPAFAVETTVAPSQREKIAAYVAERNAGKFAAILEDKNKSIALYRKHAFQPQEVGPLDQDTSLIQLRSHIDNVRSESYAKLNQLLLDEFKALGIQFEQATWDDAKKKEGKPIKRALTLADIEALTPFHWGYEFDQIINGRGGFDAIITNPPWDVYQKDEKEFLNAFDSSIRKKKIAIEDWTKQFLAMMCDAELKEAWLDYSSSFVHTSRYFKTAKDYSNQTSVIDGSVAASKINLYKLFIERSFRLLCAGGYGGMITPGSVYTDRGAMQLREMLLRESSVNVLFGISNERFIFEEVHHAQKLCIFAFCKGKESKQIQMAFRINPREAVASDKLDAFLHSEHLDIAISLIRRLSPDSLSVMEFKNLKDVAICERMLRFPMLGESVGGSWNVSFTQEFNMTTDSPLFQSSSGEGRLPLFEGKMIWQFDHQYLPARYWINEVSGRRSLLGRDKDIGQMLDYQVARLGFRDIASNTNERTMVAAMIPPAFHGNKLPTVRVFNKEGVRLLSGSQQLFLAGVWNSFVIDAMVRMKVTTTLNFFYIYQLPVPRLTEKDLAFAPIVSRAAKLICTTPQFDDLAREVGLGSHTDGVTDPAARAALRGELDGLIAHLYGLTDDEFAYILTTFPLVPEAVKLAARNAYRQIERGLLTL